MTLLHVFDLTGPWALAFFAVLTRVGFIVIFLPLWGEMSTPQVVRVLLILAVTLALTPVTSVDLDRYPETMGGLMVSVGLEATFGFSVGLIVRLMFAAVMVGGQIAGEQMGFAVANVMAPDLSSQITVVANVKYVLALLLFFSMNFHLVLFRAIAQSMEAIPPFQLSPSLEILPFFTALTQTMFVVAIKMAAPVLATMIFVNIALGLTNKAAPQVNVLMESFPIRILLGLFMFSTIVGALAALLRREFLRLDGSFLQLFRMWS